MSQASDRPLEFRGGGLGIGCGQRGESREAVGVAAHCVGQYVVGLLGERDGDLWRHGLGPGCGDGQDLHVHATDVHPGQTFLADVEQTQVHLPPGCSFC